MDQATSHDRHLLLGDLLEHLRLHGFPVGVDTYVRAQRLLDKVSGGCAPEDLRTILCPLFASDRKQQDFFYLAFDQYFELAVAAGVVPPPPDEGADAANSVPGQEHDPFWARSWPYVLIGLALTAVITSAVYYSGGQGQVITTPTPTPFATPTPTVTPAPQLALEASEMPRPEIVRALRWLAFFGPPVFLILYNWYLYNQRKLLRMRLRSNTQPLTLPLKPDQHRRRLFDSEQFYNAARLLKVRQHAEFFRLDIEASIGATIRELGFPSLRYKRSTRIPEYLALIERITQRDHQSRLFEELALSLEDEGVAVDRYYFSDDPRVCFKFSHSGAGRLPPTEGERLKHESGASLQDLLLDDDPRRLLIFSGGEALVDPISGEMRAWTAILNRCGERALLTPTAPAEWGGREVTLSKNMIVAPASLEGLRALVEYFETGEVESLGRWARKEPASPPRDLDSRSVVRELRTYLGHDTFQWLCACAVYPRLQWDMTLFIGMLPCMPSGLVSDENLLRLIRLPWFRESHMPEDVRQLLMRELNPKIDRAVRAAIIELLQQSPRTPLTASQPPPNVAVPDSFFKEHEKELRKLARALPPGRVIRDDILAKYLEAKPNRFLDSILPQALLNVFYPNGNTSLRMKPSVVATLTLSLMLGAWLVVPRVITLIAEYFPGGASLLGHQPQTYVTPTPVPVSLSGEIEEVAVVPDTDGSTQVFIRLSIRNSGMPTGIYKYAIRITHATSTEIEFKGPAETFSGRYTLPQTERNGAVVIQPQDSILSKTQQAMPTDSRVSGWLRLALPLPAEVLSQPGMRYSVSFADVTGTTYSTSYELR